ncbi:uncharacterized protein N7469_003453 [Penicillium citrinum]|uniref:Uncharacterized protein n=1 Tax=Penicillium citrinum TaxID=5077 RepID=A0A9W9P376_PENCI|nr:uncharacterized protein N7469_003453 [Penicillium citrinum]KAJ5234285.1 hypothetical protein N7469_003453 [Penicillium citrinum]
MALMAAAYEFRNAQAFRQTSRALFMDYATSLLDVHTDNIEEIMDWRVIRVNVRIALRISTAKLAFAFTVSCLTSEIQGMDVSISATYNGNYL